MKKLLIIAAAAVVLTGCSTNPNKNGVFAGMAIHQGYTKIAAKQNDEFKAKVDELWLIVDKVESTDELVDTLADKIAFALDELIKTSTLTDTELGIINSFRKLIRKNLLDSMKDDIARKERAVEWLKGVREGIRIMRNLDNPETLERGVAEFDAIVQSFDDI